MSPAAPNVTDPLPQQLRPHLERLTDGLDERIPSRRPGRNILVATWNLREFGDPDRKWRSRKGDKPRGHEGSGGSFDFDRRVMRRMGRVPLCYRISDHYPLWVESLVPRRSGS